jgi:hypothetical protein
VESLEHIFFARDDDFFRCADCRHLWRVQKGRDGPARDPLPETIGTDRQARANRPPRAGDKATGS